MNVTAITERDIMFSLGERTYRYLIATPITPIIIESIEKIYRLFISDSFLSFLDAFLDAFEVFSSSSSKSKNVTVFWK